MADEQRDTYEATKARLEEIAAAVKKKDVSLEKSIELLEEGVRLANLCTEQVDQVNFVAPAPADADSATDAAGGDAGTSLAPPTEADVADVADTGTGSDELEELPGPGEGQTAWDEAVTGDPEAEDAEGEPAFE